jgi:integrase
MIKPKSITRFSQAFKFTQQYKPTWSCGSAFAGNCVSNYNHIMTYAAVDPKLEIISHSWLKSILEEYADDRASQGQDTSGGTLNRHLATVRTVMKVMAKEEYIDRVPVFQQWEESEGRTNFYRKEEVDQLIHYSLERDDIALAHTIQFAAYTGLRQGELRKLRVRDVDWRDDIIHVGGTPETRTKAKNYRVVGIADSLKSMLKMRTQGRDRMGYVFDEWSSGQQLYRKFLKVRSRLIHESDYIDESYVFHTLRHSYGTWQIQAGTPLIEVKYAMGHKNVSTTERYLHNTYGSKRQMANAI